MASLETRHPRYSSLVVSVSVLTEPKNTYGKGSYPHLGVLLGAAFEVGHDELERLSFLS